MLFSVRLLCPIVASLARQRLVINVDSIVLSDFHFGSEVWISDFFIFNDLVLLMFR